MGSLLPQLGIDKSMDTPDPTINGLSQIDLIADARRKMAVNTPVALKALATLNTVQTS